MLTNIYSSWIGVKALCNYKQIFVKYFCNFSIWSGFNLLIIIFLQYAMANSTCILFMSQGFTSLHVPLLCKYKHKFDPVQVFQYQAVFILKQWSSGQTLSTQHNTIYNSWGCVLPLLITRTSLSSGGEWMISLLDPSLSKLS